jgi:hypothetical protein
VCQQLFQKNTGWTTVPIDVLNGLGDFPSADFAAAPGTYSFSVEGTGGFASVDKAVAEGDVKDLAFSLPTIGTIPARFDTNLTFADARALPDAQSTVIASSCERPYTVPSSATGTVNLKAFVFPECTYKLQVPGREVVLSQTATNNITMNRLDVDDVTVTREDGTTYAARGTFELYYGGAKIAGPYNTSSGIDALPGDYEIVVKYTTALGQQTNRYTAHF